MVADMNVEVTYTSAVSSVPRSRSLTLPLPPRGWRLPAAWRQTFQFMAIAVLGFASYLIFSRYVIQTVEVIGGSMQPTLRNSDRCLLNRWVYHVREPHRFEVVVLKDPAGGYAVKRIIGMGGDSIHIEHGAVFVNGNKLSEPYLPAKTPTFPIGQGNTATFTLEPGRYFVMGDNRLNSADSREYGAIPRSSILGAVVLQ
jgi:signal peptidase I